MEGQDWGVMFTYNTLTWFNDNEVTWQWTLNLYVSLSSQFSWHISLILNLFSHMTVPQSLSSPGTRLFELVFCCHQFWVVCLYLIGERFLVFINELLQSLAFFSNDFYLRYTWKHTSIVVWTYTAVKETPIFVCNVHQLHNLVLDMTSLPLSNNMIFCISSFTQLISHT